MTTELRTLVAKDRIAEVIHTLFVATDRKEWETVRECFRDEVLFDMTSLAGGSPGRLTPRKITDAWEEGLSPLKAVHHQVGNLRIRVDGARAHASCYGIATHYRPNPTGRNTRTFVGSYDFELAEGGGRWRIGLFRFNLKYLEGNLEIERG